MVTMLLLTHILLGLLAYTLLVISKNNRAVHAMLGSVLTGTVLAIVSPDISATTVLVHAGIYTVPFWYLISTTRRVTAFPIKLLGLTFLLAGSALVLGY